MHEINDKYCWYFYPNIYKNPYEYDLKLKHSELLIVGFRLLLGDPIVDTPRSVMSLIDIFPEKKYDASDILSKCAKDHLNVPEYKHIYDNIIKARKYIKNDRELRDKLKNSLTKSLKNTFGKPEKYDYKGNKSNFVFNNIIPTLVGSLIEGEHGISLDLTQNENFLYVNQGSIRIAKGISILNDLELFFLEQNNNNDNLTTAHNIRETIDVKKRLDSIIEEEIWKLIFRIQAGQPLLGSCELCPKVVMTQK